MSELLELLLRQGDYSLEEWCRRFEVLARQLIAG
jgi:hypothetical protein